VFVNIVVCLAGSLTRALCEGRLGIVKFAAGLSQTGFQAFAGCCKLLAPLTLGSTQQLFRIVNQYAHILGQPVAGA
jgi:hypothetical protein